MRTLPPAQLQRSGTSRAETEQPLLREQQPLEMRRLAGAEQVSGDRAAGRGALGGRGTLGGRGQGVLGPARVWGGLLGDAHTHTQVCALTRRHTQAHTSQEVCGVSRVPGEGAQPLVHACTPVHTRSQGPEQADGHKHAPNSHAHCFLSPSHVCLPMRLHTHACTSWVHIHAHTRKQARRCRAWCRVVVKELGLQGAEGDIRGTEGDV